MISTKHACIFVHIPKAGGSSIEDMIWPLKEGRTEKHLWMGFVKPHYNKHQTGGLQHLLARQIQTEVTKEFFNRALKFTMVRNPWDKVISQYEYMMKRDDLREFIGMNQNTELIEYLELISKKEHVQWEEQHKFFLDDNGDILVNDILRFENYSDEVSKILHKLGIEIKTVLHSNKGNREHYSQYYNRETREFVSDMYSKDVELLGYSYNGAT